MTHAQLLRLPEVETRYGAKRTSIQKHIDAGIFPPPIKLGKTTLWPADEVEAVVRARIAELGDDQLRGLVKRMMAARKSAAAARVVENPKQWLSTCAP